MKTLIISDIHSNIHALEAIWQQERDCDQVYCAGDLVDYGPYPKEVVNWVREKEIPCVKGNHDAWVALCYRRKDDPDQSAHYATITDGAIALHRLNYDLLPVHKTACQVNLKESEMRVAEHIFSPQMSG